MESCLDQKEEEDLLFNTPGVMVHTSSESQHNEGAGASDGLHSTRWVCSEANDDPWIEFDFEGTPREKQIRPKRLRLSQANSSFAMRGYYGAIQEFSVSVNGEDPEVHTFPDSVISTSSSNVVTVDLGKFKGSLRNLRIQILKATPGKAGDTEGSPLVGFSYIELFK